MFKRRRGLLIFTKVASVIREKTPGGTWSPGLEPSWPSRGAIGPRMVRTALCVCPVCDRAFALTNHRIHADGTVSPSIVCTSPGCTFHDFIVLDGWSTSAK